jgi:hypothetical protein
MTEWSPAAWGEQWKQLAIGDSGFSVSIGVHRIFSVSSVFDNF